MACARAAGSAISSPPLVCGSNNICNARCVHCGPSLQKLSSAAHIGRVHGAHNARANLLESAGEQRQLRQLQPCAQRTREHFEQMPEQAETGDIGTRCGAVSKR